MDQYHHIWDEWSVYLHRWGMNNLVASFLEAAGPLTIFGAQAVYLSQPFLKPVWPEERWQALTSLLENSQDTQRFAAYLRDQEIAA
jgi:hypothetical protein